MPISRDPRMDRRRRFLRDNADADSEMQSTSSRRKESVDEETSTHGKRDAGYSQDVRNACGLRLVQLIPIRRRSYTAAIVASLLIPMVLMLGHYGVFVSGQLPWYGHPLAQLLDASNRNGLAAWFSSHLWLLCLIATVLTFQIRRHKLDDYKGEYRLWYWLVATCLIGSIDATTNMSYLFGLALDRWSQVTLGWTGPAVVHATMSLLIGMLALRLCTELKVVPTSLIFWLVGIVSWGGAAALMRDELNLEMTIQWRIWLKCVLWLGGLTSIWLAALSYLRHVYIDAQRRFLARGRLAARQSAIPMSQRIREKWDSLPGIRKREGNLATESIAADQLAKPSRLSKLNPWSYVRARNSDGAAKASEERKSKKPANSQLVSSHANDNHSRPAATGSNTPVSMSANASNADRRVAAGVTTGLPNTAVNRTSATVVAPDTRKATEAEPKEREGRLGGWLRRNKSEAATQSPAAATSQKAKTESSTASDTGKKGWFGGWLGRPKFSEDAGEFKKVGVNAQASAPSADSKKIADKAEQPPAKKRWLSGRILPKAPSLKLPKMRMPKVGLPKIGMPKIKFPSFDGLKLNPPADESTTNPPKSIRPIPSSSQLPGTDFDDDEDDSSESSGGGRPLTKAERKKLRRIQQQNRAA